MAMNKANTKKVKKTKNEKTVVEKTAKTSAAKPEGKKAPARTSRAKKRSTVTATAETVMNQTPESSAKSGGAQIIKMKTKAEAPAAKSISGISRAELYLQKAGLCADETAQLRQRLPIIPIDTELVELARRFVAAHPGGWAHQAWTDFLKELSLEGYDISSDPARHHLAHRIIGVLLETLRATAAEKDGRYRKAA